MEGPGRTAGQEVKRGKRDLWDVHECVSVCAGKFDTVCSWEFSLKAAAALHHNKANSQTWIQATRVPTVPQATEEPKVAWREGSAQGAKQTIGPQPGDDSFRGRQAPS